MQVKTARSWGCSSLVSFGLSSTVCHNHSELGRFRFAAPILVPGASHAVRLGLLDANAARASWHPDTRLMPEASRKVENRLPRSLT